MAHQSAPSPRMGEGDGTGQGQLTSFRGVQGPRSEEALGSDLTTAFGDISLAFGEEAHEIRLPQHGHQRHPALTPDDIAKCTSRVEKILNMASVERDLAQKLQEKRGNTELLRSASGISLPHARGERFSGAKRANRGSAIILPDFKRFKPPFSVSDLTDFCDWDARAARQGFASDPLGEIFGTDEGYSEAVSEAAVASALALAVAVNTTSAHELEMGVRRVFISKGARCAQQLSGEVAELQETCKTLLSKISTTLSSSGLDAVFALQQEVRRGHAEAVKSPSFPALSQATFTPARVFPAASPWGVLGGAEARGALREVHSAASKGLAFHTGVGGAFMEAFAPGFVFTEEGGVQQGEVARMTCRNEHAPYRCNRVGCTYLHPHGHVSEEAAICGDILRSLESCASLGVCPGFPEIAEFRKEFRTLHGKLRHDTSNSLAMRELLERIVRWVNSVGLGSLDAPAPNGGGAGGNGFYASLLPYVNPPVPAAPSAFPLKIDTPRQQPLAVWSGGAATSPTPLPPAATEDPSGGAPPASAPHPNGSGISAANLVSPRSVERGVRLTAPPDTPMSPRGGGAGGGGGAAPARSGSQRVTSPSSVKGVPLPEPGIPAAEGYDAAPAPPAPGTPLAVAEMIVARCHGAGGGGPTPNPLPHAVQSSLLGCLAEYPESEEVAVAVLGAHVARLPSLRPQDVLLAPTRGDTRHHHHSHSHPQHPPAENQQSGAADFPRATSASSSSSSSSSAESSMSISGVPRQGEGGATPKDSPMEPPLTPSHSSSSGGVGGGGEEDTLRIPVFEKAMSEFPLSEAVTLLYVEALSRSNADACVKLRSMLSATSTSLGAMAAASTAATAAAASAAAAPQVSSPAFSPPFTPPKVLTPPPTKGGAVSAVAPPVVPPAATPIRPTAVPFGEAAEVVARRGEAMRSQALFTVLLLHIFLLRASGGIGGATCPATAYLQGLLGMGGSATPEQRQQQQDRLVSLLTEAHAAALPVLLMALVTGAFPQHLGHVWALLPGAPLTLQVDGVAVGLSPESPCIAATVDTLTRFIEGYSWEDVKVCDSLVLNRADLLAACGRPRDAVVSILDVLRGGAVVGSMRGAGLWVSALRIAEAHRGEISEGLVLDFLFEDLLAGSPERALQSLLTVGLGLPAPEVPEPPLQPEPGFTGVIALAFLRHTLRQPLSSDEDRAEVLERVAQICAAPLPQPFAAICSASAALLGRRHRGFYDSVAELTRFTGSPDMESGVVIELLLADLVPRSRREEWWGVLGCGAGASVGGTLPGAYGMSFVEWSCLDTSLQCLLQGREIRTPMHAAFEVMKRSGGRPAEVAKSLSLSSSARPLSEVLRFIDCAAMPQRASL